MQVTISASAVAAAGLIAGIYRIQATVAADAQNLVIFDGALRLTASPGAAVSPPIYCTFEDMKVYAPWIDNLLETRDELTGFAVERGRAREWLDDLICRNYRGGVGATINDPGGNWMGLWGSRRSLNYSPFILQQLQLNNLIVRPAIIEAVAKYALGLVCQAQLGKAAYSDYSRLADRFLAEAHNAAICLTAEIDVNGDGIGDVAVSLGTTNTFWA